MAKKAAYEPHVEKLSETTFSVQSESNSSAGYKVEFQRGVYICSCPHFVFRGVECKHILAIKNKFGKPEQSKEVVRSQSLLEML